MMTGPPTTIVGNAWTGDESTLDPLARLIQHITLHPLHVLLNTSNGALVVNGLT